MLFISVFALAQINSDETWDIDRLAGGFVFTEGPVWKTDRLYFSDLGDNKIFTWSEENGVALFLDPSGKTNGITFSRDESILYVSDSGDKEVYAWDVSDTLITNKRLFATIGGNGYIDGMTTDDQGRLYVAGPIGKQCSNCNWGAVTGTDLFVTSGTELYRVRKLTTGTGLDFDSRAHQEGHLLGIHPNPFWSSALISVQLSGASQIRVKIFDSTGKYLSTLYDQFSEAGNLRISWDGGQMTTGLYYIRLESELGSQTQKCILLK